MLHNCAFTANLFCPQQYNVRRSSCEGPEAALKQNIRVVMAIFRPNSLAKQIVITDKPLRSFSELVRVGLKHFTRSDGISNEAISTVCPTRYRTRHFFNNSNTNEDIAAKFEQKYVRCVRNEKECVCSAPNCCDTEQRSASQPGSVASGTHCIKYYECVSVFLP